MSADKAYTVEEVMGCRIITGPVPIRDMISLMAEPDGEEWLTDLNLGTKLGATMVLGPKECLDRLSSSDEILARITKRAVAIKQEAESAGGVVPQAAFDWLIDGERGKSSEAIFAFLTQAKSLASSAYPRDAHDFRRCRLLIDRVPEFKEGFTQINYLSPTWAKILKKWSTLCAAMESDSPAWQQGIEKSTRFDFLLKNVLEEA